MTFFEKRGRLLRSLFLIKIISASISKVEKIKEGKKKLFMFENGRGAREKTNKQTLWVSECIVQDCDMIFWHFGG